MATTYRHLALPPKYEKEGLNIDSQNRNEVLDSAKRHFAYLNLHLLDGHQKREKTELATPALFELICSKTPSQRLRKVPQQVVLAFEEHRLQEIKSGELSSYASLTGSHRYYYEEIDEYGHGLSHQHLDQVRSQNAVMVREIDLSQVAPQSDPTTSHPPAKNTTARPGSSNIGTESSTGPPWYLIPHLRSPRKVSGDDISKSELHKKRLHPYNTESLDPKALHQRLAEIAAEHNAMISYNPGDFADFDDSKDIYDDDGNMVYEGQKEV